MHIFAKRAQKVKRLIFFEFSVIYIAILDVLFAHMENSASEFKKNFKLLEKFQI